MYRSSRFRMFPWRPGERKRRTAHRGGYFTRLTVFHIGIFFSLIGISCVLFTISIYFNRVCLILVHVSQWDYHDWCVVLWNIMAHLDGMSLLFMLVPIYSWNMLIWFNGIMIWWCKDLLWCENVDCSDWTMTGLSCKFRSCLCLWMFMIFKLWA